MFKVDFLNKKVYWLREGKNKAVRLFTFDIIDNDYIMFYGKKKKIKDLSLLRGRYEKTVVLEVPKH